jgi:ABC-type uncharacterized transport system substrate-binding protein
MAGLVPAIHAFVRRPNKTWMPATSAGMTDRSNPQFRPFPWYDSVMKKLLAALVATFAFTAPALAHPHVWVTMKSELVYAADGSITGIRHAWAFDDMFSTFALQGLETKQKGVYTREELKPLAEVNVTSLKEYDYFTYVKVSGKKTPLTDPVDYWLDFKDAVLTLNFTLPFKTPLKAKELAIEVYDPSYFVDFALAEKDAITLAGAPASCKLTVAKPQEMSVADGKKLSEADFTAMADNWGAQYANRILVKCP